MEAPERHCLICYSKDVSTDDGPPTPSSSSSQLTLWRKVRAPFLLRNIFEVPKASIDKYLEFILKYELASEDWLDLCQKCNDNVRSAQKCYEELVRISKTFQNLKHEIIQTVRKTQSIYESEESLSPRKRKLESGAVFGALHIFRKITLEETRGFVLRRNYDQSQLLVFMEDPWLNQFNQRPRNEEKNSPEISSVVDELINGDGTWLSMDDNKDTNHGVLFGTDLSEEALNSLSLVTEGLNKHSPEKVSSPSKDHLLASCDKQPPLVSMSPIQIDPSASAQEETSTTSMNVDSPAQNVYHCETEGCQRAFESEELLDKHVMLEHGLNLSKMGEPIPVQNETPKRMMVQKNGILVPSNFLTSAIQESKRKRGRPPKPKDSIVVKPQRKVGRPRKNLPIPTIAMPTLSPVKTELTPKANGNQILIKRSIPSTRMPILNEQVRRVKRGPGRPKGSFTNINRQRLGNESDICLRRKHEPVTPLKRKRGRPPTKNVVKVDEVKILSSTDSDDSDMFRPIPRAGKVTGTGTSTASSSEKMVARKRGRPKKSDSKAVPLIEVKDEKKSVSPVYPCSSPEQFSEPLDKSTPVTPKRKGRPPKRPKSLVTPCKDNVIKNDTNNSSSPALIDDSKQRKDKDERESTPILGQVKREIESEDDGSGNNRNRDESPHTQYPLVRLEKLESIPGVNSRFLKIKSPPSSSCNNDAASKSLTSPTIEDTKGTPENKLDEGESVRKKRKRGRPRKTRENEAEGTSETVACKEEDETNVETKPCVTSISVPQNDPSSLFADFHDGEIEEVSINIVFKCHICKIQVDNQKKLEKHLLDAHVPIV